MDPDPGGPVQTGSLPDTWERPRNGSATLANNFNFEIHLKSTTLTDSYVIGKSAKKKYEQIIIPFLTNFNYFSV